MKTSRYWILPVLWVLSLSACKLDLSSNINIGDLNRVALSQEVGVTTKGTLKLEVGSVVQCKSEGQFLTSVLEDHL